MVGEAYPSSSAVSVVGMEDASVSSKLISKLAGIMRIIGLVTSCKPSNGVIYIYNHEICLLSHVYVYKFY